MQPAELLKRFSKYSQQQLAALRRTPVLDQLPTEFAEYTDIAKTYFAGVNDDWAGRQRLVSILCELLYHDGRSFHALLWIAGRAVWEPEYVANGMNSLAGLSCYLNMDRPAPLSDEELLEHLKDYAANPDLRHNAERCRDLILRRRPDLCDSC